MSYNHDKRVKVITDFLVNRAKLGRVTTFKEVAYVVGKQLGRTPERGKVAKALAQVAANSYESDQVILPALVVHFNDNRPGHRFVEWASAEDLDTSDPTTLHQEQLDKIFELAQSGKLGSGAHWRSGDRRVNLDDDKQPGPYRPKRASLFASN
jgi:hypothetical protein